MIEKLASHNQLCKMTQSDQVLEKTFLHQIFWVVNQGWLIAIFIDGMRQRFHFTFILVSINRTGSNGRDWMMGMCIHRIWLYSILKILMMLTIFKVVEWNNQIGSRVLDDIMVDFTSIWFHDIDAKGQIKSRVAWVESHCCWSKWYHRTKLHVWHCLPRACFMTATFCCCCSHQVTISWK